MADKLTYKGGATVVGQTGNEMQLVRPAKGSTHRFPRWWNKKGTVAYVECAIFKVSTTSFGDLRLVIPVDGAGQTLEIRHDGDGGFTFPVKGNTERVAVVGPNDTTLYKEYQFSKISGGSVLTRTIQAYPAGVSFSNSGSITGTLEVGETITINGADFTGGIGTVSTLYVLQKSDTGSGGWTTVATSTTEPFTNNLAPALDGKYLRVSTQITDDTGLNTRNGTATAAVTTPVP